MKNVLTAFFLLINFFWCSGCSIMHFYNNIKFGKEHLEKIEMMIPCVEIGAEVGVIQKNLEDLDKKDNKKIENDAISGFEGDANLVDKALQNKISVDSIVCRDVFAYCVRELHEKYGYFGVFIFHGAIDWPWKDPNHVGYIFRYTEKGSPRKFYRYIAYNPNSVITSKPDESLYYFIKSNFDIRNTSVMNFEPYYDF